MPNAQQMLGNTAARSTFDSRQALADPRPIRLGVDQSGNAVAAGQPGYVLRHGAALAQGTTTKVRVQIGAFGVVYVLVKLSAFQGTVTATGYPMLSDAGLDEAIGTRRPIGGPSAVVIADTSAHEISYTCKGEAFIEIELVVSNAGGDNGVIDYVEVYGA